MMPEQADLLSEARDSLEAAKLLQAAGYHGFAALRAYYAMFYVAEAFLLGRGLAFSKHGGVQAAFGEYFVRTGIVPVEYHRYLIRGMDARHAGDYRRGSAVTPAVAAEQIDHAARFLKLAEQMIGPVPPSAEEQDDTTA